jgi:hypothetical protein
MMTRLHPFDYVFAELADSRFEEIREQGWERDLTFFGKLPAVRSLLEAVSPPDADGDADALAEYLASLFVAFRYWEAGRHTYRIGRDDLERRWSTPTATLPPVPEGACYVEFPERWFWAQIDQGAPHEPLDGLFVAASGAPQSAVTVVAVLGLRPERGGFSQITVTGDGSNLRHAVASRREPPFAAAMEGGAATGFRSITSEGELLHLASLALATLNE